MERNSETYKGWTFTYYNAGLYCLTRYGMLKFEDAPPEIQERTRMAIVKGTRI